MAEKQTQYELEKQYQEELRADWARQQKPQGLVNLEEHTAEEQLKNELRQQTTPELTHYDSLINKDEQQIAAERLEQMREVAKQKAKQMMVRAVKKVAQAAWKKFALWFATTVLPWIGGVLVVLLVVFMVVVLTLYLKCKMVGSSGIFKPVLSWVGITCDAPAGSGGTTTTNAAPAAVTP